MESKVNYKLNHQKFTQEWTKHCKGRFRKLNKKVRRQWNKRILIESLKYCD